MEAARNPGLNQIVEVLSKHWTVHIISSRPKMGGGGG